jgi:acetolactate synthase-1/2/3 large subunit
MKNQPDGGEAIVEAFRRLGVEYIVTSPGSEWSPVWEALTRQQVDARSGPQFIQCWHETLAVNIATGYTMMTGRPQAVLLHAAAGMLQGALGLFAATRAEVPLVVLSGESITLGEDDARPMEGQWYAGVSVGGSDRLVAPLVKWSGRVHSAITLYQSVIRAGEMAARTPKGVVHLDVPLEYMLADWTPPQALASVPPAPSRVALPADIERLAERLVKAKSPMIVAEQSGVEPRAFEALTKLADLLAIPVIGAPGANFANFPYDNPLWLGVGAYQHLESADLVLLAGGRTPWTPPSRRRTRGHIAVINGEPMKSWLIYQNLQADEYVEGEIAHSLTALAEAASSAGIDRAAVDARRSTWSEVHRNLSSELQGERQTAVRNNKFNIAAICEVVRELMPPDAIYIEETVTHAIPLRKHLPLNRPQSFFRHNGGGLGQGIGMALGIKLAAPDQPVVLFAGDGSMLYNPIVQAFGSSKQYDLPILIIVLNNQSYESMGRGHRLYYPEGVAQTTDLGYGVKIDAPPFEELGRPFGFFGARATNVAEFRVALAGAIAALKERRSAVINAMV